MKVVLDAVAQRLRLSEFREEARLSRHCHVIHFVRDTFVTKGLQNLGVMNEKHTGQLEGVANDLAKTISEHNAVSQSPLPNLKAKQLPQSPMTKRERLV